MNPLSLVPLLMAGLITSPYFDAETRKSIADSIKAGYQQASAATAHGYQKLSSAASHGCQQASSTTAHGYQQFSNTVAQGCNQVSAAASQVSAAATQGYQQFNALAAQECYITTLFRTELQFEQALSYGYQPNAADLFLVIRVAPAHTQLVRTLIDDYGVFPEFIDQDGNNALHLIPLCPETVRTVCCLIRSNVRTAYENNAGFTFMDRLAIADFDGKEEIEALIENRSKPFVWPAHNDSDSSHDVSEISECIITPQVEKVVCSGDSCVY